MALTDAAPRTADVPAGSGLAGSTRLVPTTGHQGYLLIGADGRIFAYGDALSDGTLPAGTLPRLGATVSDVVGALPTRI